MRGLSSYFWAETRGGITLCMVNVRRGLSRLTGVKIRGVGDMTDIFVMGISEYAKEVEQMFNTEGQGSQYIGYDANFGKTHFTPLAGANMGMLFTDTRHSGGRK